MTGRIHTAKQTCNGAPAKGSAKGLYVWVRYFLAIVVLLGLTLDCVLSFEVYAADNRLVSAKNTKNVTWDSPPSFCNNTGLQVLTGALPEGGAYSGTYVDKGEFDTDAANPGGHWVTYSYTDGMGNSSSSDALIIVFENPQADAGEAIVVPNGGQVVLDGSATEGSEPYDWQWSPAAMVNNANISGPQTLPMGNTVNFTLTVSDANGCKSTDNVVVAVANSTIVSLMPFDPVCVSQSVVGLTGGNPLGGKYYVNNQTSSSEFVIPANLGPGEHQIHYLVTDNNGHISWASQILTIYPLPQIEWAGAGFCDYGGWVDLEGALPEGGTYFGNHVINNRFNLSQAVPGLYSIYYTLTDANGCSATKNAMVEVHKPPHAEAGPNQTVVLGETAWLTAEDGGENVYEYEWSPSALLPDPMLQVAETHPLISSQVFNLIVTDLHTKCVADDFTIVQISGGDVEITNVTYGSSVCYGDTVSFEVLAGGGSGNYNYYWYNTPPPFGFHMNLDTGNPVWKFQATTSGNFTYYLRVVDGNDPSQYADGAAVIDVFELPVVNLADIHPVCANSPGYFFPDYEFGIYYIYQEVGGFQYEIPIPYNPYPYFNPAQIGEGEYTVIYEVTNEHGCSNKAETGFEIWPYVKAEFYLRVPDRCFSNAITIKNDSKGANSFVWDFGTELANIEFPDGWTPDMVEFDLVYPTVTAPQEFTITLTVEDEDSECDDVISRSFTVYPRAEAFFVGEYDGCAPHTIQFEDQSTTGQALYHFWRFGDGSLSMEPNPEKTFYNFSPVDSVFTVSLTIATQDYYCTETYSADVTVYPQTVPGFAIDPVEHCSPYEAVFSNEALHAEWITFDMGEGTSFTTDEPDTLMTFVHEYTNLSATPDTLFVTQTIGLDRNDDQVCVKEFTRRLVILPQVKAVLTTINVAPEEGEDFVAVCAPFTVEFSGTSSLNGHSFSWIFDDGGTSSAAEPSHTFYNPTGSVIEREVILRTETLYGCVDYDTLMIHVLPEVHANYTFLPQSGCSPLEVAFTNTSVSGSAMTWSWSDENGDFSQQQHPLHTFWHTLTESVPQEYQVQLLAVNAQGCSDYVASVITVNPEVQAHIHTEPAHTAGVLEVCVSETIRFYAEHTNGPSMHADYYDWSFGHGDASSVSMNPEFTYHQPGTYTVTLGASSQYNCSDEAILTVVVHPLPNPAFTIDVAQGCSPMEVNLNYGAAPVAGWTYLWDFDFDGTPDYTSYAHDALPASHTFTNTGTEIETFTMQFRIESPQGCAGQFSRDVVVWPEVSAVIKTTPEHVDHELSSCAQFEVALDGSESHNATEFLWDFGDGITSTQASPVHTFLNFDPENAVTYNVLLTARSQIGCLAQETLQVEVTPRPLAGFAVVMPLACSPAEVEFINTSIGATAYEWDFGDGNASIGDNPTHVYEVSADDSPTTFTVTLRAINDGCENVYQQQITIYPYLEADFDFEIIGDGCHPLAVNFTNTTTGHPDHLTFTWNYGDGNSSFTGNEIHQHVFENFSPDTDQTFTVQLTASYGDVCIDVVEKYIVIPARPKALFTVPNSPGCGPHDIEVINLSEGAVAFQWDFGDGSDFVLDEHPAPHTYTRTPEEGPGNYIIQLHVTGANDCVQVYEQEILIYPEIHALFSMDDAAGCHPHTVEFTNHSTGVETYSWNYGNGHTSGVAGELHSRTFNNFSHSEEEVFTVTLQVVSEFGCMDEISAEVTVYPVPEAAFHTSTAGGCSTLEVEFFNTSNGKGLTFEWDMDNGTETIFAQSPPAQLYEVGADQILTVFSPTLTVTNPQGCVNVITHDIYVYPEVEAAFEVNVSEGCHPLTVEITNLSEGDYDHLNFEWDYGDNHTSETQAGTHSHTFYNYSHDTDETFILRLTAWYADECVDVFEKEITVLARPKASFTVSNSPGCAPHPIEVVNQSLGAVSWSWNFGNGSEPVEEANPDPVTYTQPADAGAKVFTITLDVEGLNECPHQFTQDVVIFPEIEALFATSVNAGCHPLEIMLEDQSSGADFWYWNYGDGHTSQTNQTEHYHTFFNHDHVEEVHDTILLTVVSEFGCTSTFQRIVRVDPVPQAIFTTDIPGGCSPLEVSFHNHSVGATQYEWDMGDDTDLLTIAAPQDYTYQVGPDNPPHIFAPVLTVSNERGCFDSDSHEIWVYPDIAAGFTASIIEGCDPLVVDFANITQGNEEIIHYKWNYGDGNMSVTSKKEHRHTFRNHSHTSDTTFMVSLRAYYSESCYDETEMEITVLARPKALFAVPQSPVCAPDSLEIINFSEGAFLYTWDMDDGQEPLTDAHPGYYHYHVPAGSDAGVFTINLLTEAGNGCQHDYSLEVTVFPEIHALFAMENHDGCHPLEVGFENLSQGVETYTWTLGDGEQSQDTPVTHTYLNYSSTQSVAYPVTLSVISPYGCVDFYADTVKVRPLPAAEMAVSETTGCSPFQPQITNLSVGGTTFIWTYGDENTAETSGDEIPVHTWHNTGEQPQHFNFIMEAINAFGCSNTTSKTLTAFPEVTAGFVAADEIYSNCSPFDVRFENQSLLAAYYTWDFGDGSSSVVTHPLHAFKNTTPEIISYDVQLHAASVYGCKDSLVRQVHVYPTPEAHFGVTPFEQPYPNTTFTFTNHTNPGEFAYEWRFGDGGVSHSQDDVFTYSYVWDEEDLSTKTYQVVLNASNDYCFSEFSRMVTITSPVPEARLSGVLHGCEPLEVAFENLSLYAWAWKWDFDDGTVSFEQHPVHTWHEHGIYDVTLLATGDGGTDTLVVQVEVFENPTAAFQLKDNLVLIPHEPLEVINRSKLGAYYLWEFGDGNSSTEYEPVHYYELPGLYDITLTVWTHTDPQCVDTKVMDNGVRADESCQVLFPNVFKPSTAGPSGGVYNPSDLTNEVFHPLYEGVYNYELEIFTRWGELIYRTTDPAIGWDGYVRGALAQAGVYVWRVRARCTTGEVIEKAGDVTLIR
ncbi:MAG: PKD domain-containing protein [Bacteroidetes bacterium]|nr:MAG: PKD domain-containing protein [Bacteroidota bacterium]